MMCAMRAGLLGSGLLIGLGLLCLGLGLTPTYSLDSGGQQVGPPGYDGLALLGGILLLLLGIGGLIATVSRR